MKTGFGKLRYSLLQFALCLLLLSPVRADWVAVGSFSYTDRLYDDMGFTGTVVRPVREADVEIFDASTGAVIAAGATDAQWRFSIQVSDNSKRTVGARVLTSNVYVPSLNFVVGTPESSGASPYSYSDSFYITYQQPSTMVYFGGITIPLDIELASMFNCPAFNIYDKGVIAADWVKRLDGARPTKFYSILWGRYSFPTSYSYNSATQRLQLNPLDGYDDYNILREIGLYILHEYGISRNPGAPRFINSSNQDPRSAFSEGFAHYVAASALFREGRNRPEVFQIDDSFEVNPPRSLKYNIESHVARGSSSETNVGGFLYDLVDDFSALDATPGSDDDSISNMDIPIWRVIKRMGELAPEHAQLEDFWDIWRSFRFLPDDVLRPVFAAHNIDFFPDVDEPNDSPETSKSLSTAYRENTFYRTGDNPAGDEDWFNFNATEGKHYRIEVNPVDNRMYGRPDPEMWLFDQDAKTVIAYNDDPYDYSINFFMTPTSMKLGDTAPSIVWRAPASGTYYVYLRHSSKHHNLSGRYGTYEIRAGEVNVGVPYANTPSGHWIASQTMLPGQSYQVMMVGTNFSTGVNVEALNPLVTVSDVRWLSPTAVVATVTPSPIAEAGSVYIVASNPGGVTEAFDTVRISHDAQPPVAITEVHPASGRIEMKNLGTVNASLNNWSLLVGSVPASSNQFIFPSFTLAPGATVVIHPGAGVNTATDLYRSSLRSNWILPGTGSVSINLLDHGGRHVDYIRYVTSPTNSHSIPVGEVSAWMPPALQNPEEGLSLSRSERTALYRTPFGLSAAAITMPASAEGRDNEADAFEDNDHPQRCYILGAGEFSGMRISNRPDGATDKDWYGISVTDDDFISIRANFDHSKGDLVLELYSPDNHITPIAVADSANNEEQILHPRQFPYSGMYKLCVYSKTGPVDYTLAIGDILTLEATDAVASEGNASSDNAVITVLRKGAKLAQIHPILSFSGTAKQHFDFTAEMPRVMEPGTSSKQFIISAIADDLAEGPESITYKIRNRPSQYMLGTPSEATVTIFDKPIDDWRFTSFGGNTPLSGDAEDADGDGLPNLMEYALGLNPLEAALTGLPQLGTEANDGVNHITLTYDKDISRTDIIYQPQSSEQLVSWEDVSDVLLNTTGAIETRKVSIPMDDPRKFLRLKITRP